MRGYNRSHQRAYDNQSPDESNDARGEAIAERAEELSYEWMSDLTRVAAALDDMGCTSDIGPTGSTELSEMVARMLCATGGSYDEADAMSVLYHAVRNYLLRDAETAAEAEYNKGDGT